MITSLAGLEQLATRLAPLDFPPGSLRVLSAESLPPSIRGCMRPGTCFGWTAPDADLIVGLAHVQRTAVIVLEIEEILRGATVAGWGADEFLRGVAIHEMAHVLTYPPPEVLASCSPSAVIEKQQAIAAVSSQGGWTGALRAGAFDRNVHGEAFCRAFGHLLWRTEREGITNPGVWGGSPATPQIREALDSWAEPWTFASRPLRELMQHPMPRVIQQLFPKSDES